MFREIFGHNWSNIILICFLVQPTTCCDLSGFLYYFEAYLINSSKMMGNFSEVLNFNWYFSNSTGSFVATLNNLIGVGENLVQKELAWATLIF